MQGGKCYIGTSGWSYAHWAKGRFYPKGLKQGEWLRFFAQHFGTVEINSSFYRMPKRATIARWRQVTGSRFRFATKLWRRVTHEKRLVNCGQELRDFIEVVGRLRPKRGPLLVQLPPSMRKDVARLDAFLAELKKITGRSRWKVAVEFRNTDWLCKQVYELLDRRGAALCLADMERCPITEPMRSPLFTCAGTAPGPVPRPLCVITHRRRRGAHSRMATSRQGCLCVLQ